MTVYRELPGGELPGGELLGRGISRLARIGIDAAFPLRCRQCDTLYAAQGNGRYSGQKDRKNSFAALMSNFLCPGCAGGYTPASSPLCSKCGRPFGTDHGEDHECPDCLVHPMGFDMARAAGTYEKPLKTLIHHFKYQGRTELARPLGRLLWDAMQHHYNPWDFDLFMPVPLHWFRRFRRGFNQSALLVRDWHRYADDGGLEGIPLPVSTDILIRRRGTISQTGLGRQQRRANLKGAFEIRDTQTVSEKRILLIDDVMTTGATAAECVKVLIRAGAASVKVLTLARAV